MRGVDSVAFLAGLSVHKSLLVLCFFIGCLVRSSGCGCERALCRVAYLEAVDGFRLCRAVFIASGHSDAVGVFGTCDIDNL